MKRLFALLLLSAVPATAMAQGIRTTGNISTGLQQIENNTNSSKLTEYRDLRDDRYPLGFRFNTLNSTGFFLDAAGSNVTRRDQRLEVSGGKVGVWQFGFGWDELPHNFSNKAVTPYSSRKPGVLEVPTTIAVPFKKLGTAAADAPKVLAVDELVAAYAQQFAKPTDLETLTKTGAFSLRYTGLVDGLDLSVGYKRRAKEGSKLSYGPIGDRPPRTLNIQLAEPVDYVTGDVRAAAQFNGGKYQARVEYLVSNFENEIDEVVWRNVYATPAAGSEYDTWDRQIGAYGRRTLFPDNKYQSATFSGGISLPFDSRFTATVASGRMEQSELLQRYSWFSITTLPRETAKGLIKTMNYSAEYTVAPVQRVNVRAFYRNFDLDNQTLSSKWQYVTQDANNLNGSVAYVNKRKNEPYAWDRQNMGADATWRLGFMKSSLVLGFEREEIGREHRQAAESNENILRASWRAQPLNGVSLRAKYLRGARDAGEYDWRSPSESYWYTAADATDNNNPKFTFEDHPDMRKFDMADRKRDQVDFTVGLTPGSNFSISTTLKYRRDDFDSDVVPVQPLINTTSADREAWTPGDQLGMLESERRQIGVDVFYAAGDRLSFNGSLGYDVGKSKQRGLEFNENNKMNPSAVATVALGPWTRKGSQWTADNEEQTTYAGAGATYELKNGISLSANYTGSLSQLDITYGGFGVTDWDGTPFPDTYQFSFQTPDAVKQNNHTASLSVDFPLMRGIGAQVGWQYESYQLRDWQQSDGTKQFESVGGTDLLLRDTSRSHQWGNRLFNMGSYLAPGFTAHGVFVSLSYSFGGKAPVL